MSEGKESTGRKRADGTPWLSNKEFKALVKKQGGTKNGPKKMSQKKPEKKVKGQRPKKIETRAKPTFEAANAQTVINIPVTFDLNSVQLMWLSVFTRMFEKSWNSMPPVYGTSYILDAYQILQGVTGEVMAGATPAIRQLPTFVQIVLNLLAPKNVNFRLNMLKYSWASQFVPTFAVIIPVFPANVQLGWVFGDPDVVSDTTYTALIIPFTPLTSSDPANLQIAFGLIENMNEDTKLKETDSVTVGRNDPSAFARTYAYLGMGNSAAGEVYGECEQETNMVKSWMPAQFSVFGLTDTRASRSFRPKSGDSCLLASLALISDMRAGDYRSGGPVIYKFIDFEEVYYFYITWLSAAWSQALTTPIGATPNNNLTTNFPFTVQTFRILLRQALLQCFSNQAAVQFMAPKPQNGNADNVFVPFLLNSGTYSTAIFGGMKFPLILAENMKMLKTRVIKIRGTKTKVVHIPVLGKWINDTYVADPQLVGPNEFSTGTGLTPSSMFLDPTGETEINLYDGNGTGPTVWYNMNALYYQTSMNYLNSILSQLTATGGKLSTVSGDDGPGLSLLNFTRYVKTAPPQMLAQRMRPFECVLEHQERVMELRKVKSKGKIQKETPRNTDMHGVSLRSKKGEDLSVNPIGSVTSDYTVAISANMALTQPMQALLKAFIIPTIRPDPTDAVQPQTYSEWQIASIEPNLAQYQTGGDALASTFRADDLNDASLASVRSILNGENSSDLVAVFEEMVRAGGGVDWLGLLHMGLGVATNLIGAVAG